jgi:SNF2 family DNA or RNA helicase
MSSAEGINLTSANHLVLLDSWWNDAKMIQVCDRIHRIGQNKTVNIYKFHIDETIEEKICKRLEQKSKINQLILNKWIIKDTKNYDTSWIKETIKLIERQE